MQRGPWEVSLCLVWFFGMHVLWWVFSIAGSIQLFAVDTAHGASLNPTPLSVLQRRYATGEISTAEFEERKAVLERDKRSVSHSASGGPVAPLAGPPV